MRAEFKGSLSLLAIFKSQTLYFLDIEVKLTLVSQGIFTLESFSTLISEHNGGTREMDYVLKVYKSPPQLQQE